MKTYPCIKIVVRQDSFWSNEPMDSFVDRVNTLSSVLGANKIEYTKPALGMTRAIIHYEKEFVNHG